MPVRPVPGPVQPADVDLSVCVVSWNGGAGLIETLGRLPALAAPLSAETIVVDNASGDGTPARIARELPEVRLVRNARNLGFARACNQAAALARGRALLFLNADAEPRPGALPRLVEVLDARAEVAAVGPRLVDAAGRIEASAGPAPRLGGLLHRIRWLRWTGAFRRAHRRWRRATPPGEAAAVERLGGAALLVRRGAPPWDEGFPFGLEDVDLSRRLAAQGVLLHEPAACVTHLGSVSSRRNRTFVHTSYEVGYARYLRKHDPRAWAAPLYKLLVVLDWPLRLVLALATVLRRGGGGGDRADDARAELAALWAFGAEGGWLRLLRA
ncbi:MAG: glycosyltransferase [Vicinamibacterales bacterium]